MKKVRSYFKKKHLLPILVIIATTLTILFNYYSIKINAGTRSYISGESKYSKGQKDAVIYLIRYIDTEAEENWKKYQTEIAVPLAGDDLRHALMDNGTEEELHHALLEGRNNPKDFDNFIWLYDNFHEFPFMQEAIELWALGDQMVVNLDNYAQEVHRKISSGNKAELDIVEVKNKIFAYDSELSKYEYAFADKILNIGRFSENLLYRVNIVFVLLLIGGGGLYFVYLIYELDKSEAMLLSNNKDLRQANLELDKFVYSVSHDLRAPLTSVKGLVSLLKDKDEVESHPEYIEMIDESMDRQDEFIKKILAYSKVKRLEIQYKTINLKKFIDEIIKDLEYLLQNRNISYQVNLGLETIISDPIKLRIILQNIISNSINYRDDDKKSFINISSKFENGIAIITIEDNGMGVKDEFKSRVFDMFFTNAPSDKGSGIGLYITKEAVLQLDGKINLYSTYLKGTTMVVQLPQNLEYGISS